MNTTTAFGNQAPADPFGRPRRRRRGGWFGTAIDSDLERPPLTWTRHSTANDDDPRFEEPEEAGHHADERDTADARSAPSS